jgi:uncharacterized damage-inducible protein DinB
MTKQAINNLLEIKSLLNQLSEKEYCEKLEVLSEATIGQHVRHILEFYQCLLESIESKVVNYDSRKRNLQIETEIDYAIEIINVINSQLENNQENYDLQLISNYSSDELKEEFCVPSSFLRELVYNIEHSIHHQALIKVAISELALDNLVCETFGYSPSTIRNKKACAQ